MATVTVLEGIRVPADKHEIVLSGPQVAKAIEEKGLSDEFYELQQLNYVSISAGLKELPPKFGRLTNVTSLVLHANELIKLPFEIGQLTKLKHLDVSSNSLVEVPEQLGQLPQLSSLNVSMNNLTSLPSFTLNSKLANLNASCNKLQNFPDCCYPQLSLLAEILLSSNQIESIPKEILKLHSLKTLDVSSNKISQVPPEISNLVKLKELNLKDNALKDKRLKKMIDQCHSKKVIDYIRQNLGKQTGCHAERKESLRLSCSEDNKENKASVPQKPTSKTRFIIEVLKPAEKRVDVFISSTVKPVRPGILCCIVRNVSFTAESFQKFIQLQNKFHDTVCDKRQKATVGTHDLKLIKSPLNYALFDPKDVELIPLGSSELCSAADFVANKKSEIAILKKEKKRNWNSGIFQYLYMLENQKEFPFLVDADERVVSLPPITNCEITKVSVSTTELLIELTSNNDKKLIREIMDKFIKELVQCGIGKKYTPSEEDGDEYDGTEDIIIVEQVNLSPEKGPKIHYPLDSDLNFPPSSEFARKNVDSSEIQNK